MLIMAEIHFTDRTSARWVWTEFGPYFKLSLRGQPGVQQHYGATWTILLLLVPILAMANQLVIDLS